MTELATQEVARARAAQIRAGIQNYLHTLGHIAAAYAQRDWKALGYDSWESYVDGEYGAERLRLTPEHRQKAVQELRLSGGMSQRAIGAVLGVDQATVSRDLRAGDADASPAEIQGADGKTYAASRPTPAPQTAAARDGAADAAGEGEPSTPTDDPAAASPAPEEEGAGAGEVIPASRDEFADALRLLADLVHSLPDASQDRAGAALASFAREIRVALDDDTEADR